MRDPGRVYSLCNDLADLWATYFPDLRFYQVISVVIGYMPFAYFRQDPFYAEEDDWTSAIQKIREQYQLKESMKEVRP